MFFVVAPTEKTNTNMNVYHTKKEIKVVNTKNKYKDMWDALFFNLLSIYYNTGSYRGCVDYRG